MMWPNQSSKWQINSQRKPLTRTPGVTPQSSGQSTPASVTPSWQSYGTTKDPWRPIPTDAMQFPFMKYLTGQSALPGWIGPNLPLVSAQMWAQLQPHERLTLQGLVTGSGLTWEDYVARMNKLSPTWSMPNSTQYTIR